MIHNEQREDGRRGEEDRGIGILFGGHDGEGYLKANDSRRKEEDFHSSEWNKCLTEQHSVQLGKGQN